MKYAKTLLEELPELLGEDSPALSVDEIAERLDRNRGAVGNLIRELHATRPEKAVYIAAWRRAKGRHAALWKWGSLDDAPELPNLTNAETCKQYRNTDHGRRVHNRGSRRWYRKNNGAALRLIDRKHKKAIAAFERDGVSAIDPLLAAIMGARK